MERVQFQQEQMLAELKDFAQKGIFSQLEIRQIIKKRTLFETLLVRRIPKKSDFLRYAAYEMDLEALRKKRVKRLKLPPSPSVSDFALVKRQFQIFERALKKFKEDVALWIQYLQIAKREGARSLVGRISARALQLHPNSPALYILAASHELRHLSHANARILLQRGLRMVPESIELWREYVKMELGFVESLRRRWEVLGLQADMDVDGAEAESTDNDLTLLTATEDSEKAKKAVLNGLVVKEVISNSAKACHAPELFAALRDVLVSYPCDKGLRRLLLDHLYGTLYDTLPPSSHPAAAKIYVGRFFPLEVDGEEFVEGIRRANEELLNALKKSGKQSRAKDVKGPNTFLDMSRVYAEFVEEWIQKDIDENLKLYLLSSLQTLCSTSPTQYILSAHLRLLTDSLSSSTTPGDRVLKLAKKYSTKCPSSADIWLLRFKLEDQLGSADSWRSTWEEAKRCVADTSNKSESVWFYGLEKTANDPLSERLALTEALLRERSGCVANSPLHDKLLIHYTSLLRDRTVDSIKANKYRENDILDDIAHLAKHHFPNSAVWKNAFEVYSISYDSEQMASDSEASSNDVAATRSEVDFRETWHKEQRKALCAIYEKWRIRDTSEQINATLAWCQWLLHRGEGKAASEAVSKTRAFLLRDGLSSEAVVDFDQRWSDILDHHGEGEDLD